ncbi:MAG TPA: DsrE family protein [Alicycliphilus sp.]|nr:DsrE family protein [Alicycliphilus sp.]HRP19766.1 DsrE family protein [Alicycliphilus sp.]
MSFTAHDAAGIAILLWSADPGCPERLATPFFHAAAAAAMDMPVEIYFSAASVRLLVPAVAAGLRASSRVEKTIADNLGEAVQLGARLFACSDALAAQGLAAPDLMPGCERGGAVQFMARAMDLRWRALVF